MKTTGDNAAQKRLFTEAEVKAIRAAALLEAADIDRKYWGAQTVVGKRILALIDQPAEAEVRAMQAAVLRQAAEKATLMGLRTRSDKVSVALLEVHESILALIDQPAEDALNAMIGAAYIDAHGENDTCAKCGHPKADHHYRHPFVSTKAEERTPADALAALERVKQAERERAVKAFISIATNQAEWPPEDGDEFIDEIAEAIRGESK